MISNHLATAAAALFAWHARTGDAAAKAKADTLVARILAHQSKEGWFEEYGGADPGYQTLCLSHLVESARLTNSDELWQAMGRSLDFLHHFVHPDGSFGGVYASRCTRIYYPAGVAALEKRFPMARSISQFMRASIAAQNTPPLAAIDEPNLMPLFNNYCAALREYAAAEDEPMRKDNTTLAALSSDTFTRQFKDAGIVIDKGARHYTIVSTRKGGVAYHWRDGQQRLIDCGSVIEDGRARRFTSQTDSRDNLLQIDDRAIVIEGKMRPYYHPLPNAFNFIILRAMALTLMRAPMINALIKKMLSKMLMGSRKTSAGWFRRTISLGDSLVIRDEWERQDFQHVAVEGPFNTIHMASQGYWQAQDDMPVKSMEHAP